MDPSKMLPKLSFVDPGERVLLEDVLTAARAPNRPRAAEALLLCERIFGILDGLERAVASTPSIFHHESLSNVVRSPETLLKSVCSVHEWELDFVMPTRAIVGNAYRSARINAYKALLLLVSGWPEEADLRGRLRDTLETAIHEKMALELLASAASNSNNPPELRRGAGERIILMWERPDCPVNRDFTPILHNVWSARQRVRRVFGTMAGIQEIFALVRGECDPVFMDHFCKEEAPPEQLAAFQEFLFGLSWEEIQRLEALLQGLGNVPLTGAQIAKHLGISVERLRDRTDPLEAVYSSYRRRKIRADYRALVGNPGPRKTAEGYLMERILLTQRVSWPVPAAAPSDESE